VKELVKKPFQSEVLVAESKLLVVKVGDGMVLLKYVVI